MVYWVAVWLGGLAWLILALVTATSK